MLANVGFMGFNNRLFTNHKGREVQVLLSDPPADVAAYRKTKSNTCYEKSAPKALQRAPVGAVVFHVIVKDEEQEVGNYKDGKGLDQATKLRQARFAQ